MTWSRTWQVMGDGNPSTGTNRLRAVQQTGGRRVLLGSVTEFSVVVTATVDPVR